MLPHIAAMREIIAQALHIEVDQVNSKSAEQQKRDLDLPEAGRNFFSGNLRELKK